MHQVIVVRNYLFHLDVLRPSRVLSLCSKDQSIPILELRFRRPGGFARLIVGAGMWLASAAPPCPSKIKNAPPLQSR